MSKKEQLLIEIINDTLKSVSKIKTRLTNINERIVFEAKHFVKNDLGNGDIRASIDDLLEERKSLVGQLESTSKIKDKLENLRIEMEGSVYV
jgi:hypothetical protein